jgi:hypothetical protein
MSSSAFGSKPQKSLTQKAGANQICPISRRAGGVPPLLTRIGDSKEPLFAVARPSVPTRCGRQDTWRFGQHLKPHVARTAAQPLPERRGGRRRARPDPSHNDRQAWAAVADDVAPRVSCASMGQFRRTIRIAARSAGGPWPPNNLGPLSFGRSARPTVADRWIPGLRDRVCRADIEASRGPMGEHE